MLALNCNSTRMSIIDTGGILTFFDLDARSDDRGGRDDDEDSKAGDSGGGRVTGGGEHLAFERKDAWDMMWAEDNPELFAMMEKTRMYIYQDMTPSDPILSSGYLSSFKDLQIKAVMLDEIHAQPEQPEKEFVLNFETKELETARELLDTVGLQEACSHVEKHSHPRLWRLLAEAALEELNFNIAERSFVRCSDFQGIQYVKRLRSMEDKMKQRAEVSAYFQRFDEAESIYREIDRKDLAIELRIRLGDWFRVLQLVQSGGGDDKMLTLAWNKIGDYYADRQKWSKAAQYYHQAKNTEALIDCFYTLEDYAGLEKLVRALPEGSDLLIKIGEKFESVGIVDLPEQHSNSNNAQRAVQNGGDPDLQRNGAVGAFLKAGDVKRAIDCCVMLNNWDRAVELAEAHSFPQIEGLLSKYATQLLEKGKELQAVELFRKANRCTDAAKLLAKLAQREGQTNFNPLRAKKLHVLSALEVERFSKRILDTTTTQGASVAQTTAQTLDNLMTHDKATGENKALDNAWHGAEAYHFYMLAQRQMYNGDIDAAMKTSLRLGDYEDVLNPKDIYSLIALTTFYNGHFQQCSKAFIRLETLPNCTPEELETYANLALEIFIENPPNDKKTRNQTCPNCGGAVKDWFCRCTSCDQKFNACTVTGRALVGNHGTNKCKVCK
jgi:WD repeat-containing protein 35